MQSVHRIVLGIARIMALLGGAVLTLLVLITCISILGRAANTALHYDWVMAIAPGLSSWLIEAGVGAIRGDFELVEAGMAFCIFAFLPFCQVTGGHASVDVFTNFLPRSFNRVLDVLISSLFAAIVVLIAVQLEAGLARKMNNGETSLLLEFPIWWAYAISFGAAVIAAVAAVYMALLRLYELVTGRVVAPNAVGANH